MAKPITWVYFIYFIYILTIYIKQINAQQVYKIYHGLILKYTE